MPADPSPDISSPDISDHIYIAKLIRANPTTADFTADYEIMRPHQPLHGYPVLVMAYVGRPGFKRQLRPCHSADIGSIAEMAYPANIDEVIVAKITQVSFVGIRKHEDHQAMEDKVLSSWRAGNFYCSRMMMKGLDTYGRLQFLMSMKTSPSGMTEVSLCTGKKSTFEKHDDLRDYCLSRRLAFTTSYSERYSP